MSAVDQDALTECMKVHQRSIQALSSSGVGMTEQMLALAHVVGAMLSGLPLEDARSVRNSLVEVIDITERRARVNAGRPAGDTPP